MKEKLIQLIRQRPFQSFVVHMSNGRTFEVRHPEMAMLTKSGLIVGDSDTDFTEFCSLLHIANITVDGEVPADAPE